MTVNMLIFDYRESEKEFFSTHDLEHFNITFYRESLNDETVKNLSIDKLDNTTVISVFVNSNVSANVISKFKNLRVITTRSTAYDHISTTAANARNIAVINVEKYGVKPVAQYTFGLILSLIRDIPAASKFLSLGYKKPEFVGHNLEDLTLGIVGTGAIGAKVADIAKFFGMSVICYDLCPKKELESYVEYVDLYDLIGKADIISVHIPYTGDNYHMFSDKEFRMMKDGSYFVNTSAGETVDTRAVYNAVVTGKLKGAALDVVTCEDMNFKCKNLRDDDIPLDCIDEQEALASLVKMENVIITPHIAYSTKESINYILKETFNGIRDYLKGRCYNINF